MREQIDEDEVYSIGTFSLGATSIPTTSLRVVQAVSGTFHHFDLARELHGRGYLARIYSTYPMWRLRREGVPDEYVRTFPWIHTALMGLPRYVRVPQRVRKELELVNIRMFDAWVASSLEDCDVFVGISGSGLKAGRTAQSRGAKYVCDRGSSHIRYQMEILLEEYGRWGFPRKQVDPRVVEREEAEYAIADAITVPSEFSRRSFLAKDVPAAKLHKVPYGVRLDRFKKTGEPPAEGFDVLFAGAVSIRKGIPYLLEAFSRFRHPKKRLRLAGPVEEEMSSLLAGFDLTNVEVLGRQTQAELAKVMSESHVMVLPSVEDGFGLVMAQAMACGTIVIASKNTGGPDLFTDGVEGFVVPIRSAEAIASRLTQLADDPDLRCRMSVAALKRVEHLGGWNDYGAQCAAVYKQLAGQHRGPASAHDSESLQG